MAAWDSDSIVKRTSHFTYDLVASILPGFAAIVSAALALWYFTPGIATSSAYQAIRDSEILCANANSLVLIVVFFILLLVCFVLGCLCLSWSRILEHLPIFLPELERVQEQVDAIIGLSTQWAGRTVLTVEPKPAHGKAQKWVVRKLAVGNDETSLVTTYHYKYHLHRSLAVVWLCHVLAALHVAFEHFSGSSVMYVVIACALTYASWNSYAYYLLGAAQDDSLRGELGLSI
jgi:hypothetical protein